MSKEKLIVITDSNGVKDLISWLQDKDIVAYDVETTGVEKDSEVIGFSVAADTDTAYYVVLSQWHVSTNSLVHLETKNHILPLLNALKTKRLVMVNGIFDCLMTSNNFGVDLLPSLFYDVLIGGHLLNENRRNGLKERGIELFGESAAEEQRLMKESVHKNGGVLTKAKYELYKADSHLLARYGAKDALLTMKVFYHDVPLLFEQGLDKFYFDEECMPLFKGPTAELNSTGLRVDGDALERLRRELETQCLEDKAFIDKEIAKHIQDKYPGTSKAKTFNINSSKQLSWLVFDKLGNDFISVTKEGRKLAAALGLKTPYSNKAKAEFISTVIDRKDTIWEEAKLNLKTGKMSRPKNVGDYWNYLGCGKESLGKVKLRYRWVERLLEFKKAEKLLSTYVLGIKERAAYGIVRPSFLQHGTTSGRYSSKNPNFQNLPRDDRRVKACIIPREGNVFVGSDYSQLEPRVFASVSQDPKLLECFANGDDFYSVIGAEAFEKRGLSMKKSDPNSFAKKHPELRQIAKVIALSATYGTTAPKMAPAINKSIDEAQDIINNYFDKFPSVRKMMLEAHAQAKSEGVVYSLYGRPRRMESALEITRIYKNADHEELPYNVRNVLNLAVNHRIQSSAASIMNRASIALWRAIRAKAATDPRWDKVKLVLQVHDELILEGPEAMANEMAAILKHSMETAIILPGVKLVAEPKIGHNLAELKD